MSAAAGTTAAGAGTHDDEFTVDELATRTGTTVRTVRFYVTEGMLSPPTRRGRVAYYGATHRRRLDLIRALQEHGYTLAAIERVLARIPDDASPAEYAAHGAVLAPWLPDASERVDRAELERRVGQPLDEAQIRFLVSVTAVEVLSSDDRAGGEETGYRISPAMLGHAAELLRLPVPREVLTGSIEVIAEHATAVAEGLTSLFAQGIWGPYQRGELGSEQVVALLERMRPLAVQGLVTAFTSAADQAARRRLESDRDDEQRAVSGD